MKGSRKGATPPLMQAWLESANDDWTPAYPFDSSHVIDEVREALLAEQRGLCVYCGKRLNLEKPGATFHIEHFRPQSRYEGHACDFQNLFLSCGLKDDKGRPSPTCGNHKQNWFEEGCHVAPIYPDCTLRFRFSLTGHVFPAAVDDTAAESMITHLNLNHPELVKDREYVLMLVDEGALTEDDFFSDGLGESYAHIVFQHVGLLMP